MVIESSKIYLKIVCRDGNIHPFHDEPIAAFVYDYDTNKINYFNFSHPDKSKDCTFSQFKKLLKVDKIFVNNKKRYKYYLDVENLYDVNLFSFIDTGDILEFKTDFCTTHLRMKHHGINQFNLIVPYVTHQKEFDKEVDVICDIDDDLIDSYCFKFFNTVASDTLFQIEKNGLSVDKDIFRKYFDSKVTKGMVHTEYSIYNPTGRPSNKFDNVNYVALNKENGCRESFKSRYDGGQLLMVDFTGFHPYLVARLIQYKVPDDETIYEHLAKQYYNIDNVDDAIMAKSKKLTMVNLYGQINESYLNIQYFQKVEELKESYWTDFINNGYVTTPIYKRKINKNHIIDPNKNKLFAYIIQATETEYGLNALNNVIKYVKGKDITPILYVYDSIVFDIKNCNIEDSDIQDIINIIRSNRFKVKVYIGNNYNELKLVDL